MENRKIKANGTVLYITLGIVSVVGLTFSLSFESFLALAGFSAYILLFIPIFFILILYLIRRSSVIILKDGFLIHDSEKEILEIKKLTRVYEQHEVKRSSTSSGNVNYFYLCFLKENGEIFKLNLVNYSKIDREYLYQYIEHYGLKIEKIDSTLLKII